MGKVEKIPLEQTGKFSPLFLDYLQKNPRLAPFYALYPAQDNFAKQIEAKKSFDPEKRVFLQEAINTQYSGIEKSAQVLANLKALGKPNTFTVATGHQLNIFSGPLYFILKIVTVVNLCKKLARLYPGFNFVPIYWMASEDHDFEEINHFYLFNKKYEWRTGQKGAVGRFNPHSLGDLLESLPEKLEIFERAYLHHKTLADATRFFVNELFGEEGLVAVDPDHPLLKKEMKAIFREELLDHTSNQKVEETNKALEALGYEAQVHSREINLFYLDSGVRERIVAKNGSFKVNNVGLSFNRDQVFEMIERHPEKFSPNVVLRPLYQEVILPNLAYVGGPAEVAYWLQLKGVFDHYKIPFPILLPRNFGMVVNKTNAKKLKKVNVQPADLFLDLPRLREKYLEQNGADYTLDKEAASIRQTFDAIRSRAAEVDKTLEGFIGAEENKAEKMVRNIEKRIKKAEEQRHDIALRQLESVKEKLFPGGVLQERRDNFLNFYLNDPGFIRFLLENLDPLDFKMNVIVEE